MKSLDNLDDRSYNNVMKNKETRKNEILKNSITLMHLNGYNGTSVKNITDAAGIPKGSFYNYFGDKEQYAVEALHYYFDEIQKEQIAFFDNQSLEPIERIKTFYKVAIVKLEEKGYKYGCLAGNMSEEMADVNPIIAEATADFHQKIYLKIYKNLAEAKKNDTLKGDIPLETLASFIISSWQGAMLRMKTTNNRQVLDEFYMMLTSVLLK